MDERGDFAGRVGFITGAGGGMGLAIAHALARGGAALGLFDRKPAPPELPARAHYVRGDVRDVDAVGDAINALHARHGRLDYLVNAAGVLWFERDVSALDIDLAVWDEVLAINLKSVVHTTRHAVPLMARGGAMVHVATIQCLRGDDRPQDAYQASKAGVIALSKSLAVQLAGRGIRSNAILPGPTLTPMQGRWADPQAAAAAAAAVPLGRLGRPEDMAEACAFLLSDRAAFITGTELIVDGGVTALP